MKNHSPSPPYPPSFLVRNSINVNAQLYRAKCLLTYWEFMERKIRIGTTSLVLNRKDGQKRTPGENVGNTGEDRREPPGIRTV